MLHLVEPTHSERFLRLMSKHYPGWREAEAELNELPLAAASWNDQESRRPLRSSLAGIRWFARSVLGASVVKQHAAHLDALVIAGIGRRGGVGECGMEAESAGVAVPAASRIALRPPERAKPR